MYHHHQRENQLIKIHKYIQEFRDEVILCVSRIEMIYKNTTVASSTKLSNSVPDNTLVATCCTFTHTNVQVLYTGCGANSKFSLRNV